MAPLFLEKKKKGRHDIDLDKCLDLTIIWQMIGIYLELFVFFLVFFFFSSSRGAQVTRRAADYVMIC